jgi:lipoyl(octanoyl) transferase
MPALDPANRGVWLDDDKLGSVGITVRRGVSLHGLALNVNTDMDALFLDQSLRP